jgi:hypothetical protein
MGRTMKSAPADNTISTQKPRQGEWAQARIIMLALVSFLLGVAATAAWFHFAPNRNAQNSSSPAPDQSNNEQPAGTVASANSPAQPFVPSHPPVDAATIEAVKVAVPNYASVSLADGTQVLRAAALKRFAVVAKEMDVRVRQAEERLSEAENGQIAAEQQAALTNLRQTQAEQTGKLQEITSQLQAQIAALQQLKNAR